MDCRSLRGLVAAGGRLDGREIDDHLARCADCRERLGPAVEPPAGFAGAVLARTSGAACPRAETRLPAWIDGELAPDEAELVGRHVERCRGCEELAAILRRTTAELPALAEAPAPPALLAGVLAATRATGAHPGEPAAAAALAGAGARPAGAAARPAGAAAGWWPDRWRATWQRLLRRPRAGLELAYVATALAVVLAGIAGSPAASVSENATAVARANPVRPLARPAARVPAWITGGFGTVHHAAVVEMPRASRQIAATALGRARDDIGTILDRVASEEERDGTTHDAKPARPQRGDTP